MSDPVNKTAPSTWESNALLVRKDALKAFHIARLKSPMGKELDEAKRKMRELGMDVPWGLAGVMASWHCELTEMEKKECFRAGVRRLIQELNAAHPIVPARPIADRSP